VAVHASLRRQVHARLDDTFTAALGRQAGLDGLKDLVVRERPPCANMTCCTWLREISEQRGSYV
jgi:hypothetical protein